VVNQVKIRSYNTAPQYKYAPDEAINEEPTVDEVDHEPPDTFLVNAAKGSRSNPFPLDIYDLVCLRAQNFLPT
jgi:hypothetical protein